MPFEELLDRVIESDLPTWIKVPLYIGVWLLLVALGIVMFVIWIGLIIWFWSGWS
jgi:cell division protein FtsL